VRARGNSAVRIQRASPIRPVHGRQITFALQKLLVPNLLLLFFLSSSSPIASPSHHHSPPLSSQLAPLPRERAHRKDDDATHQLHERTPEPSRLHHRLRFRQHRSMVNLLPRRRRRRRSSSSSARVHSARSPLPRCFFVCIRTLRVPPSRRVSRRQREREFSCSFLCRSPCCWLCFFPGNHISSE